MRRSEAAMRWREQHLSLFCLSHATKQHRVCTTMVRISRISIALHKGKGDAIWSTFGEAHDEALAFYDDKKLDE
jgi:hypothetical protein